jgi:hypothetical protein
MIPFVGHYLAVLALWFCIKKFTNGDIFPHVALTVAVCYALVFCVNLFVIGALMGHLRPSAKHAKIAPRKVRAETEHREQSEPLAASPPTDAVAERVSVPEPARQPEVQVATNSTQSIVKDFTLKGVIESSEKPVVTVHSGVRNYSMVAGESRKMETKGGRIVVRCNSVRDHQVLLTISGELIAFPYN